MNSTLMILTLVGMLPNMAEYGIRYMYQDMIPHMEMEMLQMSRRLPEVAVDCTVEKPR